MHVCAEKICTHCGYSVVIDEGDYPEGRQITVNIASYNDDRCKHCQHCSYLVRFTMKPPDKEKAS